MKNITKIWVKGEGEPEINGEAWLHSSGVLLGKGIFTDYDPEKDLWELIIEAEEKLDERTTSS